MMEETMAEATTTESPRDELSRLLSSMDVPSARVQIRDESDVHWLGRNVALNNPEHEHLERVRKLLKTLGARMVM